MQTIQFRLARPDDAGLLTAIANEAKAHWGYPARLLKLWAEDLSVTPSFIESESVVCAVERDDLVGFAAACERDGTWELEHLWVRPAWMGRGIGTQLLDQAAAQARQRGAEELRIVSDPNAEGFYLRLGAERVGETESAVPDRRLPVLTLDLLGRS